MDIFKNHQNIYEDSAQKIFEVKRYFLKLLPFWIAGSITAIVATTYASMFEYIEKLSLILYKSTGYWFILIPPVFFFLSWYFVEVFAPKSNGSGIPQLMVSVDLLHEKKETKIESLLGLKIIFIKIISSLLSLVGGGAIGREGPTLQISGSIFYLFGKHWKLSDIQDRSGFILAGAASGLASAFNTPLGGIVYVVEELAKSHLSTFRTGVIHAVIFAGVISQMIKGPYLYLGFPKISDFSWTEIGQYLVISVASALIIVIFSYILKVVVNKRSLLKRKRDRAIVAIASGFIFSALAIFYSAQVMGPGKDLLTQFLFSDITASSQDVFSRLMGTVLTYSNGGAGGIFAPTLSLAGSMGSFINGLFIFNMGAIATLIGMTSGLAALTHSPLTSFILILEMTDRHRAIFPLMLAAMIGHGISKFILKKSFYEFVSSKIIEEMKEIKSETKSH